MVTKSLDVSDMTLLSVSPPKEGEEDVTKATVFASPNGLAKLRTKVEAFSTKNRTKKDGSEGRPYNADLVQSINAIVEAGLRALWRSPSERFPDSAAPIPWELWLEKSSASHFINGSAAYSVTVGSAQLEFPEDIVVIAVATQIDLVTAIRRLAGVRAIAIPTVTAEYFDSMPVEEQDSWLGALQGLTTFESDDDPSYVTLLDTGVSVAHPLIGPVLASADRHAADPAWAVDDANGHGTLLAGLAIYGDLTTRLQSTTPISVSHRLESVKIIPDAGQNPHHLLGATTRAAIDVAEVVAPRRRIFAMATTTEDDTPHDGAPTSWSSEIDQLAAGVSGLKANHRLFVISAGNTDQNLFSNHDYLSVSHHPDNELESPAHAWNAICVGAYTEKVVLPSGVSGSALAPFGDLAPCSRTATWSSHWPIKPDVVMEGGNWLVSGPPPPLRHAALGLLTTDHQYPSRIFSAGGDTSGATALAAKAISDLWSDYRSLWPETIRALFVASARWTPQMRSHLPTTSTKGDYTPLFQRYGYGVPDMERARRSASNAFALIVQDTIKPYQKSAKGPEHVHGEMKVFELPWPVDELRKLTNLPVTLRVALSTFIAPNPSEPARGSKFRYASHNLRFKLNRPNESPEAFLARISKAAEAPDTLVVEEDDGWLFGRNRRDVGSIHIDELTCPASDLARRNMLAVHPVGGWWKTRTVADPTDLTARFSLVVEIDAGNAEADLYAEVQAAIENLTAVETKI